MKVQKAYDKLILKARRGAGFLLTSAAVLLIMECNKSEKERDSMNGKDLPTDTQNTETFQEIGFFGEIKRDCWDEFLAAVQKNIAHSREEPGNLCFSLYIPEEGTPAPIWFERFTGKAAHEYHKRQPYFRDAIAVIQKSVVGEPVGITLREVCEIPATVPPRADNPKTSHYGITLYEVPLYKRQSFIAAVKELITQSRDLKMNLEANIYQYADDPKRFVLIQGWTGIGESQSGSAQDLEKRFNPTVEGYFVCHPAVIHWSVKDISTDYSQ
ncbi:hypothetical protein FUA48_15890 [Flavobacterium alkalisoli]|uniref:ABM domain-containing protein n=1 Tax=Flavobacterium alkalisoli TaxID=2602769 RepID=A0A5B9FUK6_9FLAO|nr:antibiotic biosynthesis monooxygenase [Flavobacterium alkalisoli]QEE51003.1 hypothetical protein FUA48_15890 [Flavobacterium alkalisoli]